MHKLSVFFLYAFLADGLLSVADVLCRHNALAPIVDVLAIGIALLVLFLGFVLFVGMVFTPRLSKRLLLPPILFLGFSLVWAVVYGEREALSLSLAETLLGLGLIVGFWDRRQPEPGFTAHRGIQNFTGTRPFFTFKNFVFTGFFHTLITVCVVGLITLSLAQKLLCKLEDSTGRYVTIQPDGVSLEERSFQKGDKEIRLISMVHVAKSGFYDEVAKGLPATATAVVLLEGISDRDNRLKGKFDYSNLAKWLGIASQKDSSFTEKAIAGMEENESDRADGKKPKNLEYRPADVDLADFSETTIGCLQAVGKILASANLNEALQRYLESKDILEAGAEETYAEILNKRNEHLLQEIEEALETHTIVVVPWGAKHMPDVEESIKKEGFVETGRTSHKAIQFQNKRLIDILTLIRRMPGSST